jgi:hypothetical protein
MIVRRYLLEENFQPLNVLDENHIKYHNAFGMHMLWFLKKKIGVGSLGAVNETSTFTTKLVCYLFA